jgi:hypothetical protein
MIQPSSLVLVAVLNDPRDLEIARLLGWYRIPLRSAPRVIGVDYLAFYQTGAFGEEKWRISQIAPVRGHELTTRAELLRDEPDHTHARHEYYKVQLGPLEYLEHPLPARKWRRITFFYTTGAHLLDALTVDDLVVSEDQRAGLWHALRERNKQNAAYQVSNEFTGKLDPAVLAMLLGLKSQNSPE